MCLPRRFRTWKHCFSASSKDKLQGGALIDGESALLTMDLSNQHCYVNLPHPLTVHNYREAFVPLFPWGHERYLFASPHDHKLTLCSLEASQALKHCLRLQ